MRARSSRQSTSQVSTASIDDYAFLHAESKRECDSVCHTNAVAYANHPSPDCVSNADAECDGLLHWPGRL